MSIAKDPVPEGENGQICHSELVSESKNIKYMNNIIFQDETNSIEHFEELEFFVGWNYKPKVDLKTILLSSTYFVIALDKLKIVGFITCNSDKCISAYIPLLEVLPKHKNQKIGTQLMTKMLEKLKNIYMIDVVCDTNLNSFYSKFNFKSHNACIIRNTSSIYSANNKSIINSHNLDPETSSG